MSARVSGADAGLPEDEVVLIEDAPSGPVSPSPGEAASYTRGRADLAQAVEQRPVRSIEIGMAPDIRTALERHWSVSAADDPDTVGAIYHDDVVVDYPQSGERIVGAANLRALREGYPAKLTFHLDRISGSGDLWVTEYVIEYDGKPVHTVSIMDFRGDKVAHEVLYFADPFEPPAWRAHLVETR